MSDLPANAGSYALHLALQKPQRIRVGALGEADFPAGEYVYLGSALGPGGLRARVGRHLRVEKPCHWHVDHLLPFAELLGIYWAVLPDRLECSWSLALFQLPGACIPVPDFGSSDCRARSGSCQAHLAAFPGGILPAELWTALSSVRPAKPDPLVSLSNPEAGGTISPVR